MMSRRSAGARWRRGRGGRAGARRPRRRAAGAGEAADRDRQRRRGGDRRPARHAGRDRRRCGAAATPSTRRSPRPACSAWSSRSAAASAAAASWSSATARRARSRRSTAARRRRRRWCRTSSSTATAPPLAVRRHPLQRPVGRRARARRYAGTTCCDRYGTMLAAQARCSRRIASRAAASRSTRRSSTRPRGNGTYFDDVPSTAAIYLDADGTPRDVGTSAPQPGHGARPTSASAGCGARRASTAARSPTRSSRPRTDAADRADRRPRVAARPDDQPRPRALREPRSASPTQLATAASTSTAWARRRAAARTVGETLNILQDYQPLRRATRVQVAAPLPRGVAAAYADRNAYLGDPSFVRRPLAACCRTRTPPSGAALIGPTAPTGAVAAGNPRRRRPAAATTASVDRVGSTTHLSVADKRRQRRLLHVHDRVDRRQRRSSCRATASCSTTS